MPDATRQPNGRWCYKNTPALRAWIRRAEIKFAADKRRVLSKHAREADRLRDLLAQPGITMPKAKKLKARVAELTARPGPWSIRDIAKETGWPIRSIQRMANTIPGANFEGGRFQFQRTADLAEWLFIQRGRFQARCNGLRRAKHPPLPGGISEHIQHLRAMPENLIWRMRAAFFQETARLPLREWTTEDLRNLLDDVTLHSRVVCEELRAELESRKGEGKK